MKPNMLRRNRSRCLFMISGVLSALVGFRAEGATSLWNVKELQRVPQIDWLSEADLGAYTLRRLCFTNEPYAGHSTRMFAYLAVPKGGGDKTPGIVLVHGGAGRAFLVWAEQWASYGYTALAIDLNGRDDKGIHFTDGGPVMSEATLVTDIAQRPIRDLWPYHGITAAIRGVSILGAFARVDSRRIGMMGISWGAYTVSVAASLDNRVAFAILAYGCGFFSESGAYKDVLGRLPAKDSRSWTENYDPSVYLRSLRAPVFWLTGTNDEYFPFVQWTKSYRLTAAPVTLLRVLPRWPHGYDVAWNTTECRVFADGVTRSKPQLISFGPIVADRGTVASAYSANSNPATAVLVFTTDQGPWLDREWYSSPAHLRKSDRRVEAAIPTGAFACFFNLTDERGLETSSPCYFAIERAP